LIVFKQAGKSMCKFLLISRFEEQTGLAINHLLWNATATATHDRGPERHGLHNYQAKRFGLDRWDDCDIQRHIDIAHVVYVTGEEKVIFQSIGADQFPQLIQMIFASRRCCSYDEVGDIWKALA
jgi:hypothetical protein